MVIDLSHVEYVSSVGIGALVTLYKRIRAGNGRLILAGVQPAVMDIFNTAHLLRLFQTAPDRKVAVRQAREKG